MSGRITQQTHPVNVRWKLVLGDAESFTKSRTGTNKFVCRKLKIGSRRLSFFRRFDFHFGSKSFLREYDLAGDPYHSWPHNYTPPHLHPAICASNGLTNVKMRAHSAYIPRLRTHTHLITPGLNFANLGSLTSSSWSAW